jgi:hypothetical protein
MRAPASLFALTAVAALMAFTPAAHAQQTAPNPQQERMKTCNTQAGQQKLSGDARKSFMSDCLSGKATASKNSQQEKMKSCNTQASAQKLTGDSRKSFMSSCLKGS